MKLLKNARGFTLLEVLIVLVILAVLAGLAIPAYSTAVEKSRAQEALSGLNASRESLMRYYAIGGTYVGATMPADGSTPTMDYNPNLAVGGQTPIFLYTLVVGGQNAFTLTATRQGGPAGTVTLNQAGVVTKTGGMA